MKTLNRPETSLKKIFKTCFKQIFKKRRGNASGNRFCNSFTNRYIIVKYHIVSKYCVTAELTSVMSQDNVININ